MKKQMIMCLLLAVVMCVGLTVPAFAAAVPALGPDAAGSVVTPRYAVHEVQYTIDLENNTYAAVMFTVAEKGEHTYFEDVLSISFYTTNPKGSHWKILDHYYSLKEDIFSLCVTVQDMEGDTPSSSYTLTNWYSVDSEMVNHHRMSAEDRSGVLLIPDSVRVGYPEEMKNTLSAKDGDAIFLVPDSVSITYQEENTTLNAEIVSF